MKWCGSDSESPSGLYCMNWFVFSNRLICRVFESLSVSSLCEPEFESSVTGFESEILGRVYMVVLGALTHRATNTHIHICTHTYIIIQRKRGRNTQYNTRVYSQNTHTQHTLSYTHTYLHMHTYTHTRTTYNPQPLREKKRVYIHRDTERERAVGGCGGGMGDARSSRRRSWSWVVPGWGYTVVVGGGAWLRRWRSRAPARERASGGGRRARVGDDGCGCARMVGVWWCALAGRNRNDDCHGEIEALARDGRCGGEERAERRWWWLPWRRRSEIVLWWLR